MIVIEAANPQVVYIPTYSPTIVYGAWPYPAYPPAPYYPPGYVAGRAVAFGAGVAVGVAWGYAWGHCDWRHGSLDIDVNRNTNINANINRSRYQADLQTRNTSITNGRGTFQHDATHRQGVAYRDQKTASQFGRVSTTDAAKARESFRGRAGAGPQELSRAAGVADRSSGVANRPSGVAGTAGASQRSSTPNRQNAFSGAPIQL